MSASTFQTIAIVAPGLETWLHAEWCALLPNAAGHIVPGGVEGRLTLEQIRRLAAGSWLAEGVRVRVGRFEARRLGDVVSGVQKVAWHPWTARDARPELSVTCKKSKLIHSGAVADRVREGLDAALRMEARRTEGLLHVRVAHDTVTLSMDAAGERLHRRGWREHHATAALRETSAAALLSIAGWTPEVPLLDPFCGSGTIAIEAARRAAGSGPRMRAHYAMDAWPCARGLATSPAPELAPAPEPARVFASDHAFESVEAAIKNARRAEVSGWLTCATRDAAEAIARAPAGCAVVTNLPYGKRVEAGAALDDALAALGDAVRARADLGPILLLSAQTGLRKRTGLRMAEIASFSNRGIHVRAWRVTPPAR